MEFGCGPKDRVSFTDLPPEIRNIIFRLTLVSDEALKVQAVHPDEYHRQLRGRSRQRRTAFRMTVDRWGGPGFETATGRFESTYFLAGALDEHVPSMAMLSLNGQTRKEATSIFYGLNTFSFTDMECLVPFMLDRTAAVVKHIESFELQFCLRKNINFLDDHPPIEGYDFWAQAVSELAQFDNLCLKKLVVDVQGQCNDI